MVVFSLTYSMIATMIRMPSVHLRYWVLARLLSKTLGVIMLFASLLCHLAFPIYVAHFDSCVEQVLKAASQLLCLFTKATCGVGDFVTKTHVYLRTLSSILEVMHMD